MSQFLSINDVESIDLVMATDEDEHLEPFDHTKLAAINMCPRWGIIRYGLHKTAAGEGRSMALEAGSAAHEVFAAIRLYHLLEMGHNELFRFHAERLFSDIRHESMCEAAGIDVDGHPLNTDKLVREAHGLNYGLSALHTGPFYDDPRDKRRTLTNIEESCIAYFQNYNFDKWRIWIRDVDDPKSDVGIEIAYNIKIRITFKNAEALSFRFTGVMDGLIDYVDKGIRPHENKTSSRIDDVWSAGISMSHQITGYCVAASVFTQQHCDEAVALGMQIPLPRDFGINGLRADLLRRPDHRFRAWVNWLIHTVGIYLAYRDNPVLAPEYTHSCNRYFNPCSMIPYCDSPDADKQEILDVMRHDEWSPLHEKN